MGISSWDETERPRERLLAKGAGALSDAELVAVLLRTGVRGKSAVADHWKRFYTGAKAPFSWKPDRVQVLDSGGLGYSTGPVYDDEGKQFARFYSTWRRESDGAWRIVFDDGCKCP